MIRVEPFAFSDLLMFEVQRAHAVLTPMLLARPLSAQRAMEGPWSYTAWSAFGVPVAACGMLLSGYAWALLAPDLRHYMLPVSRAVRRVMADYRAQEGPVFAEIDSGYPEAVRWAKLLGFQPEGAGRTWVYR